MSKHYPLADDTWDVNEIIAINRVIASNRYTMGPEVEAFEQAFAAYVGTSYAIMSNSGSSANLLMIAALIYSGRLSPGDEVLVPSVSWSTTYAPLQQFGLQLRFLDINPETLNMDLSLMEDAITPETKMVFAVNLLGNPNDFHTLSDFCSKNNLFFIEDNCESFGGIYKEKPLGTFGLMGSFSTFFSHHLCTMEGGMTVTNDQDLYHYMLSIRAHGWTRNLPKISSLHKKNHDPFFENFNFILPGFNLRPLEMEGALGLEQLKKADRIIAQRRKNATYFIKRTSEVAGIRCQKETGKSSWFGFALILEGSNKGKRQKLTQAFKDNNIDVRPIVAGNFTRHKAVDYMNYSIHQTLTNADDIHDHGFFVGNHSKDNCNQIDLLFDVIKDVLHNE